MKIITRKEAQARGLVRYYTGKACLRGHVSERYTYCGKCLDCSRSRERELYASDPEYAEQKRTRAKNYGSNRRKDIGWVDQYNADRRLNYAADVTYRADRLANNAKRRAMKLDQTPPDANLDAIDAIYADVPGIEDLLGVPCAVDHWTALANGGLHHQDNLVIMTAKQNSEKGAKLDYEITNVFEQVVYRVRIR